MWLKDHITCIMGYKCGIMLIDDPMMMLVLDIK